MYFLTFLDLETVDTKALFTLLQPPLEGSGEVVFGEGTDDPLPCVHELLLCLGDDCQLSFQHKYKEEVCRSQVRSGRRARDDVMNLLARNAWTLWALWTGNLGTHLADFVTRLRSLCRMLNMVPYEV